MAMRDRHQLEGMGLAELERDLLACAVHIPRFAATVYAVSFS